MFHKEAFKTSSSNQTQRDSIKSPIGKSGQESGAYGIHLYPISISISQISYYGISNLTQAVRFDSLRQTLSQR